MRVNEYRSRRATTPDFFEHLAVGHLRESVSAILLRGGHAEHADTPQPIDHAARNICSAIDLRRVKMFVQKLPKLAQRLVQLGLLVRRNPRIWHHPVGDEMPLEQSLGKSLRLRPCKKQFLSLLNLLLSLLVEFIHSIEKRATNSSRARSRVQSCAAVALLDRSVSSNKKWILQLSSILRSATPLACSAFGADAASAGADDFVAAAHRTGNAHEDTAECYSHAV